MSINNPLDNQNYINKDFQTIYPELLDLVKKLTYKWDPSISNESDPGVILLKLNAIIADKNNYNIDKNILECFPDTVTQTSNAYKLFSQLGYNMSWYKAAIGKINVKYTGDVILAVENDSSSAISFPIDLFTMFCDEDEEIVYTCIENNGARLKSDGEITSMKCIQGVVNSYTVGSSNIIKASALDTKNRIYFPISNIAENGIFITNATKNIAGDYEFKSLDNMWTQVDNLHIQSLNTKCYQFGVDQDNGSCYVEFPVDVTNLIGEGLFINYIQTLGEDGNIAANRMTKFYTDYNVSLSSGETLNLSSKSKVSNASSIVNGSNPESIDEAFINYKKVIGTFDTLVTLRDYLNYITRDDYELVSNGVVSDRTIDIQDSYKVMTTYDGIDKTNTVIVSGDDGDSMSAFDLKTYFLKFSSFPLFTSDSDYNSIISTLKRSYDKSFEFLEGDSINDSQILGTSETIRNLYEDSKSVQHNFIEKKYNRPLLFKNKFTLDLTIIPKVQITTNTREEIQRNIYEALYKSLYSRNISFGEELTYETIYDICNRADNRVKAVAVNSVEYKPYAVMYLKGKLANTLTDEVKESINYKSEGIYDVPLVTELSGYRGNNIAKKVDIRKEVALEVLAKNILKGTTPLYDADTTFTYDYNVEESIRQNQVEKVSTYTEVEFKNLINPNSSSITEQKMLDNESIVFYAPNLIEKTQYSVSIKYVYYTTDVYADGVYKDYLPANYDIMLKRGQVLYTFWKNEDSNDAPYMYAKYGEGDIIHTTSNLYAITNSDSGVDNGSIIKGRLEAAGYNGTGQIIGTLNDDISDLDKTILSATKILTIKELNKAKLTDINNYCYWITNDKEKTTSGKEVYKLTLSYDIPDDSTLVANYNDGEVYIYDGSTTIESQSTTNVSAIQGNLYIGRPETKYINYIDNSGNELSQDVVEYKFYKITSDASLKDNNGYIYATTIRSTGNIENNIGSPGSNTYELYTNLEEYFSEAHNKPYTVVWYNNNYSDGGNYEYPVSNRLGITNYHTSVTAADGDAGQSIELGSAILKSQILDIIVIDSEGRQVVSSTYSTNLSLNQYGDLTLYISGLSEGTYEVILQLTPQGNVNSIISDTINGALNTSKFVKGQTLLLYRNSGTPTFNSSDEGTSSFSYQLRTNEYFLYTDEKYQELHFLGMGTTIKLYKKNSEMSSYLKYDKVTRDSAPNWTENTYYELDDSVYTLLTSKPEDWDTDYSNYYTRRIDSASFSVPTTDYAEIVTGGIDSMKSDMWYNFRCNGEKLPNGEFIHTSGNLIEFTENKLIILGEGTTVKVSLDSLGTTGDDTPVYWDDYANLKIKYDGVYVGATGDGGVIHYTKQSNVLSNYSIQYLPPEEGSSWQTLPESIDSRLSWNAYTLLDINAGANVPQPLYIEHKQRFILHTSDGQDVLLGYNDGTLEGYDSKGVDELVLSYFTPPEGGNTGSLEIIDGITQDKINLQTSSTVNLSGGQDIEVTAEIEGEIKYLDFYSYTNTALEDNTSGYTLVEEDDGSLLYTAIEDDFGASGDSTYSIKLSTSLFSFNDHIMPIEILSSEPISITTFKISVANVVITPIGYAQPEDIYTGGKLKNKIYYVKLNLTGGNTSSTVDITISTKGWPAGQSIRIHPLFVYDYMRNSNDSDYKGFICDEDTLIRKISELDVNKDFNYIYQPSEDTKITNPLSPASYFNNNHFCNKFTISQISKIDIQTLNVRS